MTYISNVLRDLGYDVEPALLDIVVRSRNGEPVFRYIPLHEKGRIAWFAFTKGINRKKVGGVEQMINYEDKYKGIKRLHREIIDNPSYGNKILRIYLSNFDPKKDEKVTEISDFFSSLDE